MKWHRCDKCGSELRFLGNPLEVLDCFSCGNQMTMRMDYDGERPSRLKYEATMRLGDLYADEEFSWSHWPHWEGVVFEDYPGYIKQLYGAPNGAYNPHSERKA